MNHTVLVFFIVDFWPSQDHAAWTREFCLSVIIHNDMVPRMSVRSIEKLRDEVLELIGRVKCNKLTIMKMPWRKTSPGNEVQDIDNMTLNDLLYTEEEMDAIALEG